MFNKIKAKIKIAKISGIIIGLLFIAMLASNIYLNCKVIELEKEISEIKK